MSFLITSLALGILWTWLALNTRGSVVIAAGFHGMINLAGNLFFAGMDPDWLSWLMPVGYGLAAVFVVVGAAMKRQHQQPIKVASQS